MFVPDIAIGVVLFLGLFFFSKVLPVASLPRILVFVYKLFFAGAVYVFCLIVTGQWKVIRDGYPENVYRNDR
jgi:hypothetical protein